MRTDRFMDLVVRNLLWILAAFNFFQCRWFHASWQVTAWFVGTFVVAAIGLEGWLLARRYYRRVLRRSPEACAHFREYWLDLRAAGYISQDGRELTLKFFARPAAEQNAYMRLWGIYHVVPGIFDVPAEQGHSV